MQIILPNDWVVERDELQWKVGQRKLAKRNGDITEVIRYDSFFSKLEHAIAYVCKQDISTDKDRIYLHEYMRKIKEHDEWFVEQVRKAIDGMDV